MSAKFICSIILSATLMTSCAPVEYAIYNGREALKEKTPYKKEEENKKNSINYVIFYRAVRFFGNSKIGSLL